MESSMTDIEAVMMVEIEKLLKENRDCATLSEEHLETVFKLFNAKGPAHPSAI
jgi:hypothetical protein